MLPVVTMWPIVLIPSIFSISIIPQNLISRRGQGFTRDKRRVARCSGNEERVPKFPKPSGRWQNPSNWVAAPSLSYPELRYSCSHFTVLFLVCGPGTCLYAHCCAFIMCHPHETVHSPNLIRSQPPVFCLSGLPYSAPNLLISYSMITILSPFLSTCRRVYGHPIEDAVVVVELAPVIRPLISVEE